MSPLVVANLLDGRIVTGVTLDASCRQSRCHLRTTEGPVAIELAEVEAVFFVRNNLRVLVNAGAVRSMKDLPAAGE